MIREVAKSRYFTRRGLRYFRLHVTEINQLSPEDLYRETRPHGPDYIAS